MDRHHWRDVLDMEHGGAHAERAGAKAVDRPAGDEGIGGDHRGMDQLDPVAGRVVEPHQIADLPAVGQLAAALVHRHPRGI